MNADDLRAMRDRLQSALRTAVLPGATVEAPGIYQRHDAPVDDLAPRFVTELTALGGAVHEASGNDAVSVARLVADIVGDAPAPRRALAWDDRWFPIPGIAAALGAQGFIVDHQQPADLASPDRRATLAAACVGITSADACLSETGSLVLVSGPGRGRLASLLPPVHVAIVARTSLTRSLPDLLAARPDLVASGSNFVCITGPSRTADIEHTLSRGVHGPREVHVIFL